MFCFIKSMEEFITNVKLLEAVIVNSIQIFQDKFRFLKGKMSKTCFTTVEESFPVDTRRRFNVYMTSIRRQRRRIDVV